MKAFMICLLVVISTFTNAQTKTTKYYNSDWEETPKEQATYYADFVKDGDQYHCTSYFMKTHTVSGVSTFADTVMAWPIGLQILYYENGSLKDSSFYKDNQYEYWYHYYPGGQLEAEYYFPENKKEATSKGYDESGKTIKHYIVEREAEFKGGQKAWESYIRKHAARTLTSDLLPKKGKGSLTVNVLVQFIVDKEGYVIKPKVLKSSGYKKVDADALQVISGSPGWKSAIQLNKPINAYRIQPLTYMLRSDKK